MVSRNKQARRLQSAVNKPHLVPALQVYAVTNQLNHPAAANNCLGVKTLAPRFFKEQGSQRQAFTYGPFAVPGMGDHDHHDMKNFGFAMPPPCSDCFVTYAQGDLQYPNGSYANANTGMWLHHVIIANLNRAGIVCPTNAELAFASGNERVPINICSNGFVDCHVLSHPRPDHTTASTQKAGYYIAPGSTFYFSAEIMNDKPETRDAALVVDWEFVPNTPGFKQATPLWLDIDGACGARGSQVPVPDNGAAKVFSLAMTPPWKATISADILMIGSHLHDGGESLQVTKNGATVCDSVAKYGESEGYVSTTIHEHGLLAAVPGSGVSKDKRAPAHTIKTPHLSSMSLCEPLGLKVQPGDEWSVRANYNLTNHKGMAEGSGLAPIMGIGVVYVVKN